MVPIDRRRWSYSSALALLRWSLAIVLGPSGAFLMLGALLGREGTGLRPWLLGGLGALEAVGALLFVLPRFARAGAVVLASSLVLAASLHAVARQAPPVSFLVYFPAIAIVVMGSQRRFKGEPHVTASYVIRPD
jgi:hypothetical protein